MNIKDPQTLNKMRVCISYEIGGQISKKRRTIIRGMP